jgi:hypothetical protein
MSARRSPCTMKMRASREMREFIPLVWQVAPAGHLELSPLAALAWGLAWAVGKCSVFNDFLPSGRSDMA